MSAVHLIHAVQIAKKGYVVAMDFVAMESVYAQDEMDSLCLLGVSATAQLIIIIV